MQRGACVKKLVDDYNMFHSDTKSCEFCKKQYILRLEFVHQKDCVVRLALKVKQDDKKFMLMAQGIFFDREMRKGEALSIEEVLEIARFDGIHLDVWSCLKNKFLRRIHMETSGFEKDETPYTEEPNTTEGFIIPFSLKH
jgi:hypothetical protein